MKKTLSVILSVILVMTFAITSLGITSITVKSIKSNTSNITLEVGKTYELKVAITPTDATNKRLTYSSANKNIATVDKKGKIKGIKTGKTTITVMSSSNKKAVAKCKVTISELAFVTLKLYMVGAEPVDTQKVVDKINEKLKKDINAKLDMTIISLADKDTKYRMLLASGEPFDMIFTAAWCFMDEATSGAYKELTNDMLKTYAPNVWRKTPEMAWAVGTYNGRRYAIPKLQIEFETHGWAYREDLRKKYKLPELKTFADFEAYLKAVKEGENMIPWDTTPFVDVPMLNNFNDWRAVSATNALCYDILKNDKVFNVAATPEFKQFIEMTRRWYEAGYWSKNIMSNKVADRAALENGKSAVYGGANPPTAGVIAEKVEKAYGWEIGYASYEALNGKQSKILQAGFKAGISIYYASKNPERSLMFIDRVHSDASLYRLFHYGIEGEHYAIDKNGKKDIPEGKSAGTIGYSDSYSIWGMHDYEFHLEVANQWPKLAGILKDCEKNKIEWPLLAFNVNKNPIKAELAAVINAWNTYVSPLICGTIDPQKGLPEALKQLENAGIEKVREEVQSQMDAYMAVYNKNK